MDTFQQFLDGHVARIAPLERDKHAAYWDATISGAEADFARYANLEYEHQTIYANAREFADLKAWRHSGAITDPVGARQLTLLYNTYLRNQVDPALLKSITELSSSLVNSFNVYRARVDGQTLTGNEIRKVLRESTDSAYRRKVWEAEKGVGPIVRDDLLRLVDLRNQAARAAGYDNYYSMSLALSEQNESELLDLFDDLAERTREPFRELKDDVDTELARRCGIDVGDLRPWHYHDAFFQEPPQIYEIDVDRYYASTDVVAMVRGYFDGLKLETSDIIAHSDLYEKPGKEQHAYCIDIDRGGDIRVLANVINDETWAGTMLHELGHAVYDRYIDPDLPFLLREHAHVFVTESIAMLFGRLSKDPEWIQLVTGISDEEKAAVAGALDKSQRLSQLVFARWCQVLVRFERALYKDPAQDLDALWWRLVNEYQLITPPDGRAAPDWATKIHVISAPVYYHNYMLGELLASQLDSVIQRDVLGAGETRRVMTGEAAGRYLIEKVFRPGKLYHWDELVRRATGEPLNAEHFVRQFVSQPA